MAGISRNIIRQKFEENTFFLMFKELCPALSNYSYKQNEESQENGPDIICQGSNQKIGIEITKLIPFAAMKSHESTEEKLIDIAMRSYMKLGYPPLYVLFSFGRPLRIKGIEVKKIALEIMTLIVENAKGISEVIQLEKTILPKGLTSITIVKLKVGAKNRWGVFSRFSAVPTVPEELIKESIKKKEELLPKYIEACDSIWLLLVVPGYNPSEWLDFDSWNQHNVYRSAFERTYILDVQKSTLRKLNTFNH